MKKSKFEGKLKEVPTDMIYLNINNLKDGSYILKIIHNNKIIKKTSFNKK
jgi:uncharacterized protein (DUF2141 family)